MIKRAVAGLLWFFSVWAAYDLFWSLIGIPRYVGPVLGLVAAAVVVIDPSGWFWGNAVVLNVAPLSRRRLES